MKCTHVEVCGISGTDVLEMGKCILHTEGEKDPERFAQALKTHRDTKGSDFRFMHFPNGFVFTDMVFEDRARFDNATFGSAMRCHRVTFNQPATFVDATCDRLEIVDSDFHTSANFQGMTLRGGIFFRHVNFKGEAWLHRMLISRSARFEGVHFERICDFGDTSFLGDVEFTRSSDRPTRFGPSAYFSDTTFSGRASFADVAFTGEAHFSGARFRGSANFPSTFHGLAVFGRAVFEEHVRFSGRFNGIASFLNAVFRRAATFDTIFERGVDFTGAAFQEEVGFLEGTRFWRHADFSSAKFNGPATFDKVMFSNTTFRLAIFRNGVSFVDVRFDSDVDFRCVTFAGVVAFDQARFFRSTSFNRAVLQGEVVFAGAPGTEVFADVSGNHEVDLRNLVLGQTSTLAFRDVDLTTTRLLDTDLRRPEFTSIRWATTGKGRLCTYDELYWQAVERGGSAPEEPGGGLNGTGRMPWGRLERLYRELKQNFEGRRNFGLAGDFHFSEKEMQRRNPVTPGPQRMLLLIYRALSGYGENIRRPCLWLLALIVMGAMVYVLDGTSGVQVMADPTDQARAHVSNETAPDVVSAKPSLRGRWWVAIKDASRWQIYDAFVFSIETTIFLRPDDLELGRAATGVRLIQSIFGPILIGLMALAIRQRLRR